MTWNDFWRQGSSFVPFVLPIDAPASDPNDGITGAVTFNDEWAPIVLGALKILTRPETWRGTDQAAVELATRRAHQLLSEALDNFSPCPGWYVTTDHTFIEFDEAYVSIELTEDCGCIGHGQVYEFIVSTNPATLSARVGIRGFEFGTDLPGGGHVVKLELFSTDPLAATPLYTFTGDDCTDIPLDTVIIGPAYVRENFTFKHVEIVAPYPFRLVMFIDGPLLCGEA